MSEIKQKYKGGAREIDIKSNYPNSKISVKLPRSSTIRIKRDESRKQGDKNSYKRTGSNNRNSKDRRLQNSDTIQGNINCPCEPQRGIRGVGLSGREIHIHMGYWTYGRRLKESLQMFRKSNLDFYAKKQ